MSHVMKIHTLTLVKAARPNPDIGFRIHLYVI
ncbi:hypothetical protein EGR_10828 [Echinococcus granulosus]|uniref:Uncharacterized protein n=1 Tax=Echinococcus granulosus TaxID=6210 RepID=W6U7G1_ECHGR|nr:hypothetical protein EGR_10828 [Echinococcus granulosus]EUB54312.1 hypothetical protein EGR_10828 [Echinococcus granulosus]